MSSEKVPRGFARFTPEQRREIAAKGGRAAQASGKAHRWTTEEARAFSGNRAEAARAQEKRYAFSDTDREKAKRAHELALDRKFAAQYPEAEWVEGSKPETGT